MTTQPKLSDYDIILINSSAGKDSQAMLSHLVGKALVEGVSLDRFVVVHADLGRVEWEGTRELAEEQTAHYGIRFEVVQREKGDLLDQVEQRGMWPSSKQRYCTSDQKRDQVAKLFTRLTKEQASLGRPVRILNCQGIRAEESVARARKSPFQTDKRASNGKRTVDLWYPIFDWSVDQVWDEIRMSGLRHHKAYDLGMSRLSCVFCIFASESDLKIAAEHNPDLLAEYIRIEKKIGHSFKQGWEIASLAPKSHMQVTIERVACS